MKSIAPAAMAAIEAGGVIVGGAVKISPRDGGPAILLWSGHGVLTIDAEDYIGLGDRAIAQRTANAVGGVAQGLTLTLSGVEPEALAVLDPDEVKGASVVLRRLIFASDGKTLLDAAVFDRGRFDAVMTEEVVGGVAAISAAIESAARGLGRAGARMRSDPDQRLINAADGYFKYTAYAGEKMLYWGGKKPSRTGDALGGSTVTPGNFAGAMTSSA